VSRSVGHGQIFEYIDERLQIAYHYFATLPSQRTDMSGVVKVESNDGTGLQEAIDSESVTAHDYEFTETVLVDKMVRCCYEIN